MKDGLAARLGLSQGSCVIPRGWTQGCQLSLMQTLNGEEWWWFCWKSFQECPLKCGFFISKCFLPNMSALNPSYHLQDMHEKATGPNPMGVFRLRQATWSTCLPKFGYLLVRTIQSCFFQSFDSPECWAEPSGVGASWYCPSLSCDINPTALSTVELSRRGTCLHVSAFHFPRPSVSHALLKN